MIKGSAKDKISTFPEGGTVMRSHLFIGVVLLFSFAATASTDTVWFDGGYLVYHTSPVTEDIYDTTFTPMYSNYFNIPVTYYDYHVDGSNPDFGTRVTSRWDQLDIEYANYGGWVDSTLSADGTPKRNPDLTDPFFDISWNIEKLFKPWTQGVTDTFNLKFPPEVKDTLVDTFLVTADTTYDIDGNMEIWIDTLTETYRYDTFPVPDTLLFSDTMFKNIEIADSLAAFWSPNEWTEDTTDSMWIFGTRTKMDPINGKGFGNEDDSTQNAGYTVRINNKFTYKGGEKIYFGADDDAYIFINNRLAIECGGFHEAYIETLYLDSFRLEGDVPLTVNQKYDIAIFMIERRMGGSIYLGGLFEFENKGAVQIDTAWDTLPNYLRTDTLAIDTFKIDTVGVAYHHARSQKTTLLGLNIPPSSATVAFEYFSISGRKVMDRKMPLTLALADKSAGLPCGMYITRIHFLDKQGRRLSSTSIQQLIVRK